MGAAAWMQGCSSVCAWVPHHTWDAAPYTVPGCPLALLTLAAGSSASHTSIGREHPRDGRMWGKRDVSTRTLARTSVPQPSQSAVGVYGLDIRLCTVYVWIRHKTVYRLLWERPTRRAEGEVGPWCNVNIYVRTCMRCGQWCQRQGRRFVSRALS